MFNSLEPIATFFVLPSMFSQ